MCVVSYLFYWPGTILKHRQYKHIFDKNYIPYHCTHSCHRWKPSSSPTSWTASPQTCPSSASMPTTSPHQTPTVTQSKWISGGPLLRAWLSACVPLTTRYFFPYHLQFFIYAYFLACYGFLNSYITKKNCVNLLFFFFLCLFEGYSVSSLNMTKDSHSSNINSSFPTLLNIHMKLIQDTSWVINF